MPTETLPCASGIGRPPRGSCSFAVHAPVVYPVASLRARRQLFDSMCQLRVAVPFCCVGVYESLVQALQQGVSLHVHFRASSRLMCSSRLMTAIASLIATATCIYLSVWMRGLVSSRRDNVRSMIAYVDTSPDDKQ